MIFYSFNWYYCLNIIYYDEMDIFRYFPSSSIFYEQLYLDLEINYIDYPSQQKLLDVVKNETGHN